MISANDPNDLIQISLNDVSVRSVMELTGAFEHVSADCRLMRVGRKLLRPAWFHIGDSNPYDPGSIPGFDASPWRSAAHYNASNKCCLR